jgi:hypothetical protein
MKAAGRDRLPGQAARQTSAELGTRDSVARPERNKVTVGPFGGRTGVCRPGYNVIIETTSGSRPDRTLGLNAIFQLRLLDIPQVIRHTILAPLGHDHAGAPLLLLCGERLTSALKNPPVTALSLSSISEPPASYQRAR